MASFAKEFQQMWCATQNKMFLQKPKTKKSEKWFARTFYFVWRITSLEILLQNSKKILPYLQACHIIKILCFYCNIMWLCNFFVNFVFVSFRPLTNSKVDYEVSNNIYKNSQGKSEVLCNFKWNYKPRRLKIKKFKHHWKFEHKNLKFRAKIFSTPPKRTNLKF
jgi:hypothetical protein